MNSTKAARATLGTGAILLGGTLAGCAGKNAPPVPPQAAQVQIAPLAARHPLAGEVTRLARAEAAFAALSQTPVAGTSGFLPGLPRLGPVRANPNLGGRRDRERLKLRQAASEGLTRYAQARGARRQSLQEQRRIELTAALRARDADAERLARQAVEQDVASRLAALATRRLELESSLAVLNGQLEQETLTVGPADPKALEAEIAKIDADPNAREISPRARLEQRRRRYQGLLDALLVESAQVTQEGARETARLAARAEAERNRQIASQLQSLGRDGTLTLLEQEQQLALGKVLGAEATGANLERQVMRAAGRAEPGDAALALSPLQVPAAASSTLAETVARIHRQRERLSQFIEESVAEAVRDTAHQHHLTVTLVRDGQSAGAADRTADFMRWIRWGEPLPPAGQ